MADDISGNVLVIVNTLLQVGEVVLEVTKDHTVSKSWQREGTGDIYSVDKIVDHCGSQLRKTFSTGENTYTEFSHALKGNTNTYGLRVLNCHPDKNFLFLVIERLQKKQAEVIDGSWKAMLDAVGDGAFDTNLETNTITFSEQWFDIFGYDLNEILTVSEWSAKIHPDDISQALARFDKYLSGEIPAYSSEMRYRCKDGSYKWILSRGVVVSKTPEGKPLRFIGTHTNINEHKIAEERFASSAQLMAKLINNLQTSILVTDEHWKVVFVNEMFNDMFVKDGYHGDVLGKDMLKNLEQRKRDYKEPERFAERTIAIVNKKEVVLNEEWELIDGRILSRDYIPLSLGSNNKGGIWKFRDITDERNMENRLEDQRLFYERILNCIPADIAVFDANHRYLFVNQNAFKNEDLRKWMIGKTDEDYARYSNRPRSFVDKRFALYDGAVEGRKQVEFIEKLISKEGKIGHHLRLIRPVFFENGSLEFIMAYGLEVTDLIKAQEELKTSIDTFSSAFDYSGIGMALLGLNGSWLDVNKVLCQVTGYTKDELTDITHHDITYPEDDEIDKELIAQLLSKKISTYTIEKRYVSKQGKIVLALLTVSLVWNNDGTPKFFIAQVVDITKKKELENEIKKQNNELEATRISLINKIAQLEELSHIIAHNLRGPAGNIKMFSEGLLSKIRDGAASDNILASAFTEDQFLEFIEESSASLINSLATLMEITEIKLNKEIAYDECNIAEMINAVTAQLNGIIFEKKAQIIPELDIRWVHYPKVYLENIVYNLISNALKYSRPGKIPEIRISAKMHNGRIQIIVKDNGLGIDLVRHGDKVFKLNQVFHVGYDSKGVGLYITKTQVESLGGTIEVRSQPNEGCEFIVTF